MQCNVDKHSSRIHAMHPEAAIRALFDTELKWSGVIPTRAARVGEGIKGTGIQPNIIHHNILIHAMHPEGLR